MRNLLISLLILLSINTSAQIKYFVGGNMGLSIISDSKANSRTNLESDKSNHFYFKSEGYVASYTNQAGFDAYFGASFPILDNFSLDAQLAFDNSNFTQLHTAKTIYMYQDKESGKLEEVKDLSKIDATTSKFSQFYLSLPLTLSYYLFENSLAVGLGLTPSYLIGSKPANNLQSNSFNKAHVGIHVNLTQEITNDVWLTLSLQDNSTKLYNPELKQSFSNLRLLKLGVRYYL